MELGGYFVYIFFMLLLVYWGRRIAQSELPFLTKLLIVFGLFVFFSLGGDQWQKLWALLWPQWALAFGFLLGAVPHWMRFIPRISDMRDRTARYAEAPTADLERQKQAAEDDLRRQEREASERLRRERQQAEDDLRREAERVRREADEKVRKAQDYARQQQRQTQAEKAKAKPDPYEVLGVSRDATKAEIKSAYRKLAAKYHPDKAAGATDEIRKLAEERFKAIKNSYDCLINE